MTRSFTVDSTLGFLQTSVPRLFLPPGGRDLAVTWKLTRQARVVVTIETKTGEVVRTLALRKYAAGDNSVTWNGLDRRRKRVKGGVYQAHVVAKSPLGTISLTRRFTVRQIAGPPRQ
jgi:flagellar hook assembly protein FlgD